MVIRGVQSLGPAVALRGQGRFQSGGAGNGTSNPSPVSAKPVQKRSGWIKAAGVALLSLLPIVGVGCNRSADSKPATSSSPPPAAQRVDQWDDNSGGVGIGVNGKPYVDSGSGLGIGFDGKLYLDPGGTGLGIPLN